MQSYVANRTPVCILDRSRAIRVVFIILSMESFICFISTLCAELFSKYVAFLHFDYARMRNHFVSAFGDEDVVFKANAAEFRVVQARL